MKTIPKFVVNFILILTLLLSPISHTFAQSAQTDESFINKISELISSLQGLVASVVSYVHPQPLLGGTAVNNGTVTANFGIVEYYPNLKSKIGFADNASGITSANTFVKLVSDIGPGIFCSNVEFDYRYKHKGEINEALLPAIAMDNNTQMLKDPSENFKGLVKTIGDSNISHLVQITGAPNQFMPRMNEDFSIKALHPGPTDLNAAASLTANWTNKNNYEYPIMWSLWNEPGHTYMGIDRNLNLGGFPLATSSFKNGIDESPEEFTNRKARVQGESAASFATLYSAYNTKMRNTIGINSQFGLASFLSGDFKAGKVTESGLTYGNAVLKDIKVPYDYLTFNTFNGGWAPALLGSRTILKNMGQQGNVPIIFTQYAPSSLVVAEDTEVDDTTGATDFSATPMEVSTQMLSDIEQLGRAADVRGLCMAYLKGPAPFSFLDDNNNAKARYEVLKMYADLPIVRTQITGLNIDKVHALAGINQNKASVLLWNEGDSEVRVPLAMVNIPQTITGIGQRVVKIRKIDSNGDVTSTVDTKPNLIDTVLTPNSVMLVELATSSTSVADPLQRRNSLNTLGVANQSRFLKTTSFADRMFEGCTEITQLPGINSSKCARNTGTYGFYDSTRSVAYLGKGSGTVAPKVTATYSNLPATIYVNTTVYTVPQLTIQRPVLVNVTFGSCSNAISVYPDILSTSTLKNKRVLDLSTVPPACRSGIATISFTIDGSTPQGTQAEIYLSTDERESNQMATYNDIKLLRTAPSTISISENLSMDTNEKLHGRLESMSGDTVWSTTTNCSLLPGINCQAGKPYVGTVKLTEINESKSSSELVKVMFTTETTGKFTTTAPRGEYTFEPQISNVVCTLQDKDTTRLSVSHDNVAVFTRGVKSSVKAVCTNK